MDKSSTPQRPPLDKNTNGCSGVPKIFIPNVLRASTWPWSRQISSHYAELKEESDAWAAGLQVYSPKVQKVVDQLDYSLLTCSAHPTLSKEHGRAACDLMHFLFAADDCLERLTPSEVRKEKEMMLDAIRNPHTPRSKEESIFGEMARQFWVNNMQNVTEVTLKRFLRNLDDYLESVAEENINKEQHRILDVKSYIRLRRRTVGSVPFFSMNELGFNIPDEVMSLPAIQEMVQVSSEMIACCNVSEAESTFRRIRPYYADTITFTTFFKDMISYNIEQMRGDDLNNIITCIMNEHLTDVNGAILWVQDHVLGLGEKLLAAMASLPQWEEPLNSQVKEYCNGLGQWVQANNDWHFESERYFGRKGPEIRKNKWMSLLPKKAASKEFGPMEVDGSLL